MADMSRRDFIKVMTIGGITIAGLSVSGLQAFGGSGAGGGGAEGSGDVHTGGGGKENHWVGRCWIWYDKGGFYNSTDPYTKAVQGWDGKSVNFFWDRMQESMQHVADNNSVKVMTSKLGGFTGNSKAVYKSVADVAIERAAKRSKDNHARVVGVAWTAYVSPNADKWSINSDYYLDADRMRAYTSTTGKSRAAHVRKFENMFRKSARDVGGVEYGDHNGEGWKDVAYGNKMKVNTNEEFDNNKPKGGLLSIGGWKNPPIGREAQYDNWYDYAWDQWTKDNDGENYVVIVLAVADGEPPQTGNLKVTKRFDGDKDRKFNFTVTYSGDGAPTPATKTFSLSNGQSWEDKDLRANVKFTVKESESGSYDTSWTIDGKAVSSSAVNGKIESGKTIEIVCENKSGYLKLEKDVTE